MANTQLEKLHSIVDTDVVPTDDLLQMYLDTAAERIVAKAFPFDVSVVDVPARYLPLQVDIAAFLYNKRGAEGESQHQENNINRTYTGADVPADMLKSVVPFAGVPQ